MNQVSTRILLSAAAVGVAGGVLAAGAGYAAGIMAAVLPVAYGLTVGAHFLPSVIGLAVLRRPGMALLTGLIAGLVASAFAPQWILRYLGTGLLVGALIELPFLITRYKIWSGWMYYVSAGFAGLILGAGVLVALGVNYFAPLTQFIYISMFVLSPALFTWMGRLIAAALERTGVVQDLK